MMGRIHRWAGRLAAERAVHGTEPGRLGFRELHSIWLQLTETRSLEP